MRIPPYSVCLTGPQLAAIGREAERAKVSQSEIIRRAVDAYVKVDPSDTYTRRTRAPSVRSYKAYTEEDIITLLRRGPQPSIRAMARSLGLKTATSGLMSMLDKMESEGIISSKRTLAGAIIWRLAE